MAKRVKKAGIIQKRNVIQKREIKCPAMLSA